MPTQSITQKALWLLFVACGLSLLSSFGCATTQQDIPTGEWSGQGMYVDYEAIGKGKQSDLTQSRSKDGVYETSLKIRRRQMYGHEALVFDIRSKRGELFNVEGKESHVQFTLVPLETLEHGAKLYACCDWAYNPSKEHHVSKEEVEQRLQLASASCIQQHGATILQIYYLFPSKGELNGFYDTFVFEGDRVRKMGRLIEIKTPDKKNKPDEKNKSDEEKLNTVYWVETLRKVK